MAMTIDNCGALVQETEKSLTAKNKKPTGMNMAKTEKSNEIKVVIVKQSVAEGKIVRIGEILTLPLEEGFKLIHASKAKLANGENVKEAQRIKADIEADKKAAVEKETERKAILRKKAE